MSTHELHEMLTEMVRQGPGHLVAFALGVGSVALILFSLHWLSRRPLQKQIRQLSGDNRQLHESLASNEAKLQILEAERDQCSAELSSLAAQANALTHEQGKLETKVSFTTDENERLRSKLEECVAETRELQEAKGRLSGQLELARTQCESLETALGAEREEKQRFGAARSRLQRMAKRLRNERKQLLSIHVARSKELVSLKSSVSQLKRQVAELTEQNQRLAEFDGKVWERSSPARVVEFRPLPQRGVKIIALANLKGGVGKTTLTANLGAMLARDKRVLLVDLDYQGSLTSLCLPPERIEVIRRRGEFIDRIMQSTDVNLEEFQRCCHEVNGQSNLRLMAADECLADIENRAMAQWLLHPEQGDVRHILRSYLHLPEVWQDYDYILLDCPPRLTTACINAFSAADFVLIPVIPDQTSAEAVPRQLRSLKNLQRVVCPHLSVLGLIANRTFPRRALVQREQAIWDSLRRRCEVPWGREVYAFRTIIRQHGVFGEAARANRLAVSYQEVEPMFQDLAGEIAQRIADHERSRPATVSAQPQSAASCVGRQESG